MTTTKLKKIRSKAAKSQQHKCFYCGFPMWDQKEMDSFKRQFSISNKQLKWFQCTAEHVIARCDGGSDTTDNIVAACVVCNSRRHQCKKPLSAQQYQEKVGRRIARGKWYDQATFEALMQVG